MKERPIIFNAEMVKATLEGRKTQAKTSKPLPFSIEWHNKIMEGCKAREKQSSIDKLEKFFLSINLNLITHRDLAEKTYSYLKHRR